jgi:NAD kinase
VSSVALATGGSRALHARHEKVVVVTRKTMLEELVQRFNTVGQAKFYLEHAGQDFHGIEAAHARYHAALARVVELVPPGVKHQIIDRAFLPQFTFGETDLITTVGPDGLVVNTAKYLTGQPIIAVNPDPAEVEGVLLPFAVADVQRTFREAIYGNISSTAITMAEAELSDGQRLLAFNDLFLGARTHVSARYRVMHGNDAEEHSSSGILISTGAGSTGWLRSIYAGAMRVARGPGNRAEPLPADRGRFAWDANSLVYVVREPWPSKTTGANIVSGVITPDHPLTVVSRMAENGVIFSDGVETDFLSFTAGLTATIRIADKKARLLLPR